MSLACWRTMATSSSGVKSVLHLVNAEGGRDVLGVLEDHGDQLLGGEVGPVHSEANAGASLVVGGDDGVVAVGEDLDGWMGVVPAQHDGHEAGNLGGLAGRHGVGVGAVEFGA